MMCRNAFGLSTRRSVAKGAYCRRGVSTFPIRGFDRVTMCQPERVTGFRRIARMLRNSTGFTRR
ncbi:hypothetical protein WT49_23455 [Burkholderia territorii]|nr:hypothetical protein WT49_23455 [Burkholderia territorii]KWE33024.1 hypothetical protein WT50_28260 [Burkholderia territorii]KWE56106.1 hypothetical protein WT51_03365 [Burkholderia territorii]